MGGGGGGAEKEMGLRVGAWSAMEKGEKKRRRVEGAKVKVERKGENGGGGGWQRKRSD